MRAVDTNVLVRLIVRDDVHQTAEAERFVERGAWVSLHVLIECVWVLGSVYGVQEKRVADVVEALLEHRSLVLQDAEVVASAIATFRRPRAPELGDCLILAAAKKAGHLPLGTFDRKLGALDDVERL